MSDLIRAYRITTERGPGHWAEVEMPHAGPGEVLLHTEAAGLCRTDLEMMDHGAQFLPWLGPFTLGHETAGTIVEVGANVSRLEVGDSVLVHSNSTCGLCRNCMAGRDPFCLDRPPNYGYGDDGGLAPFMKARQRDVVALNSLDPRTAAPLADAGATAYGALLDIRPYLHDEGYVAVIGVGGVGGVAVQLLRLLTGMRIIAIEQPPVLPSAIALGAHEAVGPGEGAAEAVMDLTRGRGVDATIDVVGTTQSLQLAAAVTASLGAISIVGLSGGTFPFGFMTVQLGVRMFASTTCSLGDLHRLVSIFERDKLGIAHQAFSFDEVETAYAALREGRVSGRAVICF